MDIEIQEIEAKFESATLRKTYLKKVMLKIIPDYKVENISNIPHLFEKKINESSYEDNFNKQQNISILEDIKTEEAEVDLAPHINENYKIKIANLATENTQLAKQIDTKKEEFKELQTKLCRLKLENKEKLNEIVKQKKTIDRLAKASEVTQSIERKEGERRKAREHYN